MFERPNFLDKLPQDKLLHYALGTVVFVIAALVASFINMTNPFILVISSVLVLGIGLEIFQKITKTGAFQLSDAIAFWLAALVLSPLLFI